MKSTVLFKLLLICVALIPVAGCSEQAPENDVDVEQQLQVYTSFYPLYDFASKIGGEVVNVHHMLPPGTDPHDYEPTSKDMTALMDADLFIYNGAGFEVWAEKTVHMFDENKTTVLQTTEQLDLLMNEEGSHHDSDSHAHDGHDHGPSDPHVWLDPVLAKQQADMIADALIEIDPEHRHVYNTNLQQLTEQFNELDKALQEVTENVERKEIVVSHAAFGYLTHRYGLEQIPIMGLSTSEEPSQKEMKDLIDYVKQQEVPYIMFEPLTDTKLADVIKREADVEALTLHPLENLTKEQLERGEDYFSIMEQNIQNLAKALGSKVESDGTRH